MVPLPLHVQYPLSPQVVARLDNITRLHLVVKYTMQDPGNYKLHKNRTRCLGQIVADPSLSTLSHSFTNVVHVKWLT